MNRKVICADVSQAAVETCMLCLQTFKPYCNLAMTGFSEMKVKSLRFIVNGRGMMRDIKTTISNTRSAKT